MRRGAVRRRRQPIDICTQPVQASACCQAHTPLQSRHLLLPCPSPAHVAVHRTQVDNGTELAFPHAEVAVRRRVALVAGRSSYEAEDVVVGVQLPGEARTHA